MIGRTLSHYRILEKLGEGGMGVVYIAEDTLLGRRVAIKTLTAKRGLDSEHFRSRFLREARAVSALSHPHIATIHDYGETEDGQPYIVMELVEGPSSRRCRAGLRRAPITTSVLARLSRLSMTIPQAKIVY